MYADKLCEYVDRFSSASLTVIGDVIVDEYVEGAVNRVSPEAPIVVVDVRRESVRLGGAANVAHNIASLGGEVSLCGVVGDDEGGELCLSMLQDLGVATTHLLKDKERPTTRKTRIIGQSQQIVRIDREVVTPVTGEIAKTLYKGFHQSIHETQGALVADYKKGVITEDLSAVIKAYSKEDTYGLRAKNIIVDPKGNNYENYYGASCIKPNRKEASQISGIPITSRSDAIKAALVIKELGQFESVMITLGELGLVLVEEGKDPFELDTIAQEVFDVSGAGDTVLAVFSLSLAVGASPLEAATIANCAAARVIREVGTAAIEKEDLKEVLQFWEKHK
jgi:rfaE bifunctional protein kinase chain/domain